MSSSFGARHAPRFPLFFVSYASFFLFAALLFSSGATPIFAQGNPASTRDAAEHFSAELNRQKVGSNAVSNYASATSETATSTNTISADAISSNPIASKVMRLAPLENPEVAHALTQSGVYVEPSMRQMAPPAHVRAALKSATKNAFPVDVLVIPPSWLSKQSTRGCAEDLLRFSRANQDGEDGLAIVVAGRDVAFAGGNLDDTTREGIIENAARTFDSESYAAGIAQIAANVAARRNAQNQSRRQLFGIVIGALCGGAYWMFRHFRRKAQRTLGEAKRRAEEALKNLAPRVEKLGADFDYALLGEDDAAHRTLLQTHQGRFFEAFSRAQRRSENACHLADWNQVESETRNAAREYSRARNVLRRLPENHEVENHAPEVVEVPPLGSDLAGARRGFALDFFTSQPVARDEMASVDLMMNGQRRRVRAARETAARVLAGETQVAVLDYGNQKRAWFDVPHFNPWTDFEEPLETLPISEITAAMRAQEQRLGGCYIGFGRDENGWFSPDYIGWNGGPHIAREYSLLRENQETRNENAATTEEKTSPPREVFETTAHVLDAS